MATKLTTFGVKVGANLTGKEIDRVHSVWKATRDNQEHIHMSWTEFKKSLGLTFDYIGKQKIWNIADKNKWLWAKIKYEI